MERYSNSSPGSATKACATPVPAGKAATSPASTATRSSPRSSVPRPRITKKISSSAMWAWRRAPDAPGPAGRRAASHAPRGPPGAGGRQEGRLRGGVGGGGGGGGGGGEY